MTAATPIAPHARARMGPMLCADLPQRAAGRREASVVDRLVGERPEVAEDQRWVRGGEGGVGEQRDDHVLARRAVPRGAEATVPSEAANLFGDLRSSRDDRHPVSPTVTVEVARRIP